MTNLYKWCFDDHMHEYSSYNKIGDKSVVIKRMVFF